MWPEIQARVLRTHSVGFSELIVRRILKKVSILPRAIDVAVNEVKFEFELRVLNGKYSCGGAREQYSKFEIQIRQKSIIAWTGNRGIFGCTIVQEQNLG